MRINELYCQYRHISAMAKIKGEENMNRQELKQRITDAIDQNRDKIIGIMNQIYSHPEYGYKEIQTTADVADFMKNELGLEVETNIAVTGCKTVLNESNKGPCVAVLGELDGITCMEHKDALSNGASHTCGHNIQIAGMLGAILGLAKSGVLDELDGRIVAMAVPAEELIELDFRQKMREEGKITYFGGKQELIKRGYFDDVDMAMMFHSMDLGDKKALLNLVSNGSIGKSVHFIGKEAHAGAAPHEGINALNAAMLAINNVNAIRETFQECEHARFHPIITKGGDIVNVVPADVRMESYVRARTISGIADINSKVNRAILAGGMAVGAQVEITDIPGYLPMLRQPQMYDMMQANLEALGLEGDIQNGGEAGGSFDFGDVCHIMPAIHPMISGIEGALHTRDFHVTDPDLACIVPAKAMAMTIVDLLCDGAAGAHEVLDNFKPVMTKEEYLAFLESNDKTITL